MSSHAVPSTSELKATELCASAALVLVLLAACRPTATYYVGPVDLLSRFENAIYLGLVMYLVVVHRPPSRFVVAAWVFCGSVLLASLYNGNLSLSVFMSYFKIAMVTYYLDVQARSHLRRLVSVGFWVLLVICLVDVLSILMVPGGLFQDVRVENEYYTDSLSGWFLGLKNNRVLWYLALICLAINRERFFLKAKRFSPSVVASFALSIGAVVTVQSSTSTMVFVCLLLLYLFADRLSRFRMATSPAMVIGVALAVWLAVVVLGGLTDVIGSISGLFGKTSALSGRNMIWAKTLVMFSQSPLFGYGVQETAYRAVLLGGVEAVNAHNQFLELLYVGGLLSFCSFMAVLSTFALDRSEKAGYPRFLVVAFLAVLLLEMMSEVIASVPVFWVLLSLVHSLDEDLSSIRRGCGDERGAQHDADI